MRVAKLTELDAKLYFLQKARVWYEIKRYLST